MTKDKILYQCYLNLFNKKDLVTIKALLHDLHLDLVINSGTDFSQQQEAIDLLSRVPYPSIQLLLWEVEYLAPNQQKQELVLSHAGDQLQIQSQYQSVIAWLCTAVMSKFLTNQDIITTELLTTYLIFLSCLPDELYQRAYDSLPENIRAYRSPQICKVWNEECDLIMISRNDEAWKKAISDLVTYHELIIYKQTTNEIPIKSVILYQTIEERTHFLTPNLLYSLELTSSIIKEQSPILYNILMICKCICYIVPYLENPLSQFCQHNDLKQSLFAVNLAHPNTSNNCINSFWNGLHYMSEIIQLLFFGRKYNSKQNGITLLDIINASGVLHLVWQQKLLFSHLHCRNLIEIYYRDETDTNGEIKEMMKSKELETLNYYWCLRTVYEAITEPTITNTNIETSRQSIAISRFETSANSMKEFLSEIENGDEVCQLLEDIIDLLFLHVDQYLSLDSNLDINCRQSSVCQEENNQNKDEDQQLQFNSHISESRNLSPNDNVSKICAVNPLGRNGYLCDREKLWQFCRVLNHFIYEFTEKHYYKELADNFIKRLKFITNLINDICWRYETLSILLEFQSKLNNVTKKQDQNGDVNNNQFVMNLKYLLHEHVENKKCKILSESVSTEMTANNYEDHNHHADNCDEEEDLNSTPYLLPSSQKRRPRWSQNSKTKRKIRRATYNDSLKVVQSHKILSNCEGYNSTYKMMDENCHEIRYNSNNIYQILESPEELVVMALMQQNLRVARQVIERFHLKSTHPQLVNDLEYVEHQQDVQVELVKICEQYHDYDCQMKIIIDHQNEYSSIVENIHKVASTGYGLSRLISLIEKFAKDHNLRQNEHFRDILQKNNQHCNWLPQYMEFDLNVVIICDLIWTLPLSYEDISSVILLIKRQQEQDSNGMVMDKYDVATHDKRLSNSLVPQFMDPFSMLENFQACISVLKCEAKSVFKTIPDLLLNTTYTLRPQPMSKQLKCEQIFNEVFYISSNEILTVGQFRKLKNTCRGLRCKYNYIKRFYTYLTTLVSVQNGQNASVNFGQCNFKDILQSDIYCLVSQLLFQFEMRPEVVEASVCGLGLNLSHVIATTLHSNVIKQLYVNSANQRSEILDVKPKQFERFITYIQNQGYSLLAYLIPCICNQDFDLLINSDNCNSRFLKQLMDLPEIMQFAGTFNNHYLLAALYSDNADNFLTTITSQKDCILTREDVILAQLQLKLLKLGVQESHLSCQKTIDNLIIELLSISMKHLHWMFNVQDIATKASLLIDYYKRIVNIKMLKELIISVLQHREVAKCVQKELLQKLRDILNNVTICNSVADIMNFSNWTQAYEFGFKTPIDIFKHLLYTKNYKLCYDWCSMIKPREKYKNYWKEFFSILMECLVENNEYDDLLMNDIKNSPLPEIEKDETLAFKKATGLNYLLLLMDSFCTVDCMIFLESQLDKHFSMVLFSFLMKHFDRFVYKRFSEADNNPQSQTQQVVDFLASKKANLISSYKMSFPIFKQFDYNLRNQLWHLIKNPLLIIEQLLMNASFELLVKVIGVIRTELDRQCSDYSPLPQICSTFPDLLQVKCSFCSNKQGHGFVQNSDQRQESSSKGFLGSSSSQLGSLQQAQDTAFILLNFNLYQPDHYITHDCIDLLLRIYATKSLDYHIPSIEVSPNTQNKNSGMVSVQLIDSECDDINTSQNVSLRSEGIKNENIRTCMCCHKTNFTMLMRRHHCRRCGKVVCYACSKYRMEIPELYGDVKVRVCVNCYQFTTQYLVDKDKSIDNFNEYLSSNSSDNHLDIFCNNDNTKFKWQLSGNITHDKLLREEFCYEHAPSVSLCLSILALHKDKEKCYNLLLFHCRKLEKFMVPNPEANFILIAKMIKCLALAMKIYENNADIDAIQENSDIIISMIESGYESLISTDPLNTCGMRKLADHLVQNQRWDLALNIHLKEGFPTTGLMTTFGMSCLKVGCYETAREKFSYCMTKLSTAEQNASICSFIFSSNSNVNNANLTSNIINIKRPAQGPPLLQDIIRIFLSVPHYSILNKAKKRAKIMRNLDVFTKQTHSGKTLPNKIIREPAINVLNTLANLKNIVKGDYKTVIGYDGTSTYRQIFRQSTAFEECIYYVLTYGSHADIIQFLIDCESDLLAALRYFVLQGMDVEIFLHHIYLPMLRTGRVALLIEQIQENFDNWELWSTTMMYICGYLEKHKHYNALYQLQVLLKDYIRASITSLRFYTMNCSNYQQLQNNVQHLHDACRHLQKELELIRWEKVNTDSTFHSCRSWTLSTPSSSGSSFHITLQGKEQLPSTRVTTPKPLSSSVASFQTDSSGQSSNRSFRESVGVGDPKTEFIVPSNQQLNFRINSRVIKTRINTIWQQLEVTNYLAACELKQRKLNRELLITEKVLKEISFPRIDNKRLPTLFDERNTVCALILLCSINVVEGLPMVKSIMKDYRIPKMKIFLEVFRCLAKDQRLSDLAELIKCLHSIGDITKKEIEEILVDFQPKKQTTES